MKSMNHFQNLLELARCETHNFITNIDIHILGIYPQKWGIIWYQAVKIINGDLHFIRLLIFYQEHTKQLS